MTTLMPNRDAMLAGVEDVKRVFEKNPPVSLQAQMTAQFTLGCLAGVMVTAGEARDRGLFCEDMLDAASGALANAIISLGGFVRGREHSLEETSTEVLYRITVNMRLRLEASEIAAVRVTVPRDSAGRA